MRMERVDVMFSAETSGGSWVVLVQNGPKAKATYFKGDDAQRLAYEYAAGVLGKKEDPQIHPAYHSTNPPAWVFGLESAFLKPTPASPWISVKERMPDSGRFVLSLKINEHMRIAEYYRGQWTHAVNGNPIEGVTHWMPLPEPPKE